MIIKPKIGVDLDGVTYNYGNPYDEFLLSKGIVSVKSEYSAGLSKEKEIEYVIEFASKRPYLWIPLIPGAVEAVNILSKFYDISLVTARGTFFNGQEDTVHRIKQDKIPYENIIFSASKGDVAKRLNLRIFVEDHLKNAINIKEKSPNTLIYLVNAEYNQSNENYGFIRVSGLEEVAKIETQKLNLQN